MREPPAVDHKAIVDLLAADYGLAAVDIQFLPFGLDPNAAAYRVDTADHGTYFLKIRFGPVNEPALLVARALIDRGIGHVLAPLRARDSALWRPVPGHPDATAVVFPFVAGENAMLRGLDDDQWRRFGATLRAVHDAEWQTEFRDRIPRESFALPSAALVRRLTAIVETAPFDSPVSTDLARFWRDRSEEIAAMVRRAETLAAHLRTRHFDMVLCHADIHAANILVADDGLIWLIDWDGPLIAPRERDFLFVVGSRIARSVEPAEEARFFAGYGAVEIDRDALVFFRYERIIQDIGEFARSVFEDPGLSETARAEEAGMVKSFFGPDGDIARAEDVDLPPSLVNGR